MKKKVVIAICVLLIPVPLRYKDGGTVAYTAVLYTVEDVHQLNPDLESSQEFLEGMVIRILGIEVFNNVS